MGYKILIIDDHQLYVEGLKAMLAQLIDCESIQTLNRIELLVEVDPSIDIILLDLRMPNGGALNVLKFLKDQHIAIPVLVVSASEHSSDIKAVLDHGALGYLPKTASTQELKEAIETTLSGTPYLPEQWADYFSSQQQSIAFIYDGEEIKLPPRVYEVLLLIDKGFTTKEIGQLMDISTHTVHDYTKTLFKRLNVTSRTELLDTARSLALFSFQ